MCIREAFHVWDSYLRSYPYPRKIINNKTEFILQFEAVIDEQFEIRDGLAVGIEDLVCREDDGVCDHLYRILFVFF